MRQGFSLPKILLAVFLLATPALSPAQHPYRIQGIVFERDPLTAIERPVAGATLRVLIESEVEGPKRILLGKSDEKGKYSIDVPIGHAWSFVMLPPPGYLTTKTYESEGFATTKEAPVFTKNHELKRAPTIGIQLRGGAKAPGVEKWGGFSQQLGTEYFGASVQLAEDGTGVVTIPKVAGVYDVSVSFLLEGISQKTAPASIQFEGAFDPSEVLEKIEKRADGAQVVKSSQGGSAILVGCSPSITDKKLTVVLDAITSAKNGASPVIQRTIKGRIVDDAKKGIAAARVEIQVLESNATQLTMKQVLQTNDLGEFSVVAPYKPGQTINLIVEHAGYAGRDINSLKLKDNAKVNADLGSHQLLAGNSIEVKVVGKDGQPLHGAVIEPQNGFATRRRIARTDEKGQCTLSDLPAEVIRLSIRFGRKYSQPKLPLKPGKNEPIVFKVTEDLPTASIATAVPPLKKPGLVIGAAAPEWTMAEWTDGKTRTLKDYRGKVVVIDFWGVWCSACINGLPALKELEARYKEKGVEFIAIHTAGTEMDLMKRHLEKHDWHCTIGIDAGDSIETGATTGDYLIQGYPTTLIIGRDGKIAFTTDMPTSEFPAQMKRMEDLAKAQGIPWPPDKGLDQTADPKKFETEVLARMNKLLAAMLSEKIQAALQQDEQ